STRLVPAACASCLALGAMLLHANPGFAQGFGGGGGGFGGGGGGFGGGQGGGGGGVSGGGGGCSGGGGGGGLSGGGGGGGLGGGGNTGGQMNRPDRMIFPAIQPFGPMPMGYVGSSGIGG